MALNEKFAHTRAASLVCTDPVVPVSGDPVVAGQIPGVAERAEYTTGPLAGQTTVALDGAYALSVKGVDGVGNSVVAVGDILYYVAADTPKLSKKATGVRFGYAREIVTTGATATILVQIGY